MIGAAFLLACPMEAPAAQTLRSHVPAEVSRLTPIGQLPGWQRLQLAIGLPLRHRQALEALLQQIYDPASPQYHRYLTPEQFADRFGPSQQDYEAVAAFARAHGLTVEGRHPNRVLLDVNGAVADIERAFHLTLRVYQHPTEARTFYAPDASPSVEDDVPILEVRGLDNFALPRALARVGRPNRAKPAAGSGTNGTFVGRDFRAAYAPGSTLTGVGQSLGLVEFQGYYTNDITSYEGQTGLTNVPVLTTVLLDGLDGIPGSDDLEEALDIEVAAGTAPGLRQIIVYEGTAPDDVLNRMATDNLARQLSCSWTWGGGDDATADQIFLQYAAQGQSFFQASGDYGAYTGSISQGYAPADNPNITVVGGTVLTTSGAGGTWQSESVWSESGGGISTTYSIPPWQQGFSTPLNNGSPTMRNIPDVALTAENVFVIYDNGLWGAAHGTSCAAPLWAALTALANQQAVANGHAPVGFINPALYAIANGTNYAADFHDITNGNNVNADSPNQFYAEPGYDLCSGLGTPAGAGLFNDLAGPPGPPAPLIVSNSLLLAMGNCTNGAVEPGETVTMVFGLLNVGSADVTNLIATLQASPQVVSPSGPADFGPLPVGGVAAISMSFTANGACGETVTARLQLQDGGTGIGSVSFNMPLGVMVTGAVLSESFDAVHPPTLPPGWTRSVVSGMESDWVTTSQSNDTAPNSAFVADAGAAGLNELVSPVFQITSSNAQLTFRHNYNLASYTAKGKNTTYYDGGVLEMAIGGGGFADILSAGGSFVSGSYNATLTTNGSGNALAGRQAWSGNSHGWISTTVNLPSSAAGQEVQLRWGCGTGTNTAYTAVGWYVDTITVQDTWYECGSNAPAVTMQPTNQVVVAGAEASFGVTATGAGPLSYQWLLDGTNLVGTDTNMLILTNAQAAQAGSYSVLVTNFAGCATSAAATLTVLVPPSIRVDSFGVSGSGITISLDSVAGLKYTLEYTTDLAAAQWTDLLPATPGDGGVIELEGPNGLASSQVFYRVKCEPR